MQTAADILHKYGLPLRDIAPGRYYTLCPKCSAERSTAAHRAAKVLGVTIDGQGVMWGCNHCNWTNGEYYNGRANGWDRSTRGFAATHDYTDADGMVLAQKVRNPPGQEPKCWWRRPDGKGGWSNGTGGVRLPLYRLLELNADLAAGQTIVVPEGEKCVDSLRAIGISATCNPHGAAKPGQQPKWRKQDSRQLRGADIVVMPDHDAQGYAHADAIAGMSIGIAKRVRMLKLAEHWPECRKGGDVSDWLKAGHTRDEFEALIEQAPEAAEDVLVKVSRGQHAHNNDDERSPIFSDDALALRFAARHGDELRYVAKWSQWLWWNGKRWQFDDTLAVFDRARIICREAAEECNKPKLKKELASAKTVAAVERLARSDPRLAATIDQWDADPWLFNTPDGVIDLRACEMRVHHASDYLTHMTAVAPGGDCPLWHSFLDRITAGNKALQEYLQRVCGYALTGSTREHALFFLWGKGANGKGTFVGAIAGILGEDNYHRAAPIETFTATKTDRHPTELADLRGARLVTATETEEGRRWAESRIKMLTGGDRVRARFMRQDLFSFIPQLKLLISGNHKPGLRSIDEATRRRFNLIPFTVTIPEHERDKDLGEKLKAEWPGILQWMLNGCLDWQERGLAPPEAVTTATAAYLEAQDSIAAWLDECCDLDPNKWERSQKLFANWKEFAERCGHFVGDAKTFRDRLDGRNGIEHKLDPETRRAGYQGICLKPPPSSPEDPYYSEIANQRTTYE
jgi:putative DNA primase/helicase